MLNLRTSEYGVTYTQSMVILFLFETQKFHGDDHEISQKNVENHLYIKGSTVTRLLARMEENGLIPLEKSQRDSRSNCLHLTEKGESCHKLFFGVLDNIEEMMTKGLTTSEKKHLQMLLQKVLANINEVGLLGLTGALIGPATPVPYLVCIYVLQSAGPVLSAASGIRAATAYRPA